MKKIIKRVGFSLGLGLAVLALITLSAVPNGCGAFAPKVAKAQVTDCPDLVQKALELSHTECIGIGRGKACYGHLLVNAQPKANVSNFSFGAQGDTTGIETISSLALNPYDVPSQQWGIAYMRTQANLPNTAVGETVTILLFGQTQLDDASQAPAVQALYPDLNFSAFQAYYFRSNTIDPALCNQMPSSGVIIQTPDSPTSGSNAAVQPVMYSANRLTRAANSQFLIPMVANGVRLDLSYGATAYMSARPGHALTVSLVSGSAQVTTNGITQTVQAGAQVQVPMSDSLQANGPPAPPTAYNAQQMPGVAAQFLPSPVSVAPPATNSSCQVAQQSGS